VIYGRRIWRVWRVFLGCDGIILGLFVWLWLLIKINGVDNLSDVMDVSCNWNVWLSLKKCFL